MSNIEKLVEELSGLKVHELAELKKKLEETWGVTAAVAVAAGPAAGGASTGGAAEQTEFEVILKSAGGNKINVIKVIREITGLGLKEAKDLVDGAPKSVKTGVNKDDADAIKKKLVEAGAEVEVK